MLIGPCLSLYIVYKDVGSGLHSDYTENYTQCQPDYIHIFHPDLTLHVKTTCKSALLYSLFLDVKCNSLDHMMRWVMVSVSNCWMAAAVYYISIY